METENIEERAAVMHRILEIMQVLKEYNNFNGVLAITAVFNSAALFRLDESKKVRERRGFLDFWIFFQTNLLA